MNNILDHYNTVKTRKNALSMAKREMNQSGLRFCKEVTNRICSKIYDRIYENVPYMLFQVNKKEYSSIKSGVSGWEGDEENYFGEIHFHYAVSIPTSVTAFIERINADCISGRSFHKVGYDFQNGDYQNLLLRLLQENGYGDKNIPLTQILSGNMNALAFASGFDDMNKFLHYNEVIVKDAEQKYLQAAENIIPGFGEDYKRGHFAAYKYGAEEYAKRIMVNKPDYRHSYLTFCLKFNTEEDEICIENDHQRFAYKFHVGKTACPDSSPGTSYIWYVPDREKISSHVSPEEVATKIFQSFEFNIPAPKQDETIQPLFGM